jgi:RHS repeat-associated protein
VNSETFNFDNEGNIKPISETRAYDVATNRLTSYGTGRFEFYDRSGNVVTDSSSGAVWKFTYDPLDRLIAARYNDSLISRYAYDALGRRIVRRVYRAGPHGATTGFIRMVYGGDQVSAEADSAGTLTLGYTWSIGTDNLVAIHKYGSGSGDWYAIEDPIRSIRGLSRHDSAWSVSYRYRIYGAALDSAGTAPFDVHYRWAGREWDAETGLYFFRSRMFDPTDERFIQEDPSGHEGGPNLYAYGDGDPTTGRDPTGLMQDNEMTASRPDGGIPSCIGNFDADCGQEWGGGGGWDALDILSHGGTYGSFNDFEEARTDANIAAYQARKDAERAARENGGQQGGDEEKQYAKADARVQVGCRDVGGDAGAVGLDHCAIRIIDGHGNAQVGELLSDSQNKVYMHYFDGNSSEAGKYSFADVSVPAGMSAPDFASRVIRVFMQLGDEVTGQSYSYMPWSNSNHFVHSVITGAGGVVPRGALPPGRLSAPGLCPCGP